MEKIITVDDIHWETSKTLTFKLAARTVRRVCLRIAYIHRAAPEVFPNPPQTNHTPRFKKRKQKIPNCFLLESHFRRGRCSSQCYAQHYSTLHRALGGLISGGLSAEQES